MKLNKMPSRLSGLIVLVISASLLAACGESTTAPASTTSAATTAVSTTATASTTAAATVSTTAAATAATTSSPSTMAATTTSAATTSAAATTALATTATGTTAATTPASGATTPAAATTTGSVPRFEDAKCPFKLQAGLTDGQNVRCGYLIVPETHATPNNGKTLRLATAILKSNGPSPAPDPLVMLQGGPGGTVEDSLINLFAIEQVPITALRQGRDIIIYDQRGNGYSQPNLNCTEITELIYQSLNKNTTTSEETKAYTDATYKCRDRLVKQGVNLQAFNSVENAADLNDLRVALKYDKLNVYGVSYGSRLALTIMRDQPQAVRSIILDANYPLQFDLYRDLPGNADRAFNELFKACAADTTCNRDYPNLKETFSKAVAQLKANPATLKIKDPKDGKTYDALINDRTFISTIFTLLYSAEVILFLPGLITTTQAGKYDLLTQLVPFSLFGALDISQGTYNSVQCYEEVPFGNADAVRAATANILPELKEVTGDASIYELCANWPSGKAGPVENQAVTSSLPTLILAGQFDPITPPRNGQEIAKTLSNSTFAEFSGLAHGVLTALPSGNCPANIIKAFLQDPSKKPDTSCTSSLRPLFAPAASLDLLVKQLQQATPSAQPAKP